MKEESGPSTAASSEERPSRVPSWLVVFAAFLGTVVGVIVARLVLFGLAGKFGAGNTVWDYRFAGKTVWDYLDVFLVPVAVALVTLWLTFWENRRQREYEAVQQRLQEQAEDAQRKRELAVERQRAQDEALQAYLDQMSQLLIEQPLRRARPGDNLSTVARARTLTVLTRLEGGRKGNVVRFLYESGLIRKDRLVLDLRGAYLSEASLPSAKLSGAVLSGVSLKGADLSYADLSGPTWAGPTSKVPKESPTTS